MGVGAFLDDLLAQGKYRECLHAAEQLLMHAGNGLEDLIELNLAVSRARLNLRDPSLALPPALLAKKIACDTKAFHLLGKAYHLTMATMYYTNQFDKNIALGYEYFEMVPPAYRLPADEGLIWHGMAHTYGEGQLAYEQAVDAASRAVRCFEQAKDLVSCLRSALFVAWNQINLLRFDLARQWIYRSMVQARPLPKGHWVQQKILLRRAKLAFAEGDLHRTMVLAHRALQQNHGYGHEDSRFEALMFLHHACFNLQEYKDALGYALAARVFALEARLFWKEYEAAEGMVNTIQVAGQGIVAELDQEYLATGLDLTRYVSDSILKSRD